MSKSGLFAHFGSKEELQLATVEAASAIFEELVIEPAGETRVGVSRLRAYVERFLYHVQEGVFPGGCFFVSAVASSTPIQAPCATAQWRSAGAGSRGSPRRWRPGRQLASSIPAPTRRRSPSSSTPSWSSATFRFVASADPAALDRVRRAVDTRLVALAQQGQSVRGRPIRSDHEGT
jgi:AcrR family transcriptional regulator